MIPKEAIEAALNEWSRPNDRREPHEIMDAALTAAFAAMAEPVAWRYRYKGGKWTVQKNKPHWYKDGMADVELEPLYAAPQPVAGLADMPAQGVVKIHMEPLGREFEDALYADLEGLAASPHSSAWQEVREYVAGMEKKEARASASLTGLLEALEHHTGERHGIMAIRHLVDRIAALELRLAEAERVIEPFAEAVSKADATADSMGFARSFDEYAPEWTFTFGQLRAARAWKEGK